MLRNALGRGLFVFMVFLVFVVACGPESTNSETPMGSEGGPCYGNGSCDGNLVCMSNVCVNSGSTGGCDSGEFDCGNGTCIPLGWKCDGEDDCGNGADEKGCDCEPDCSGRECGLDPVCGESCGTCSTGYSCEDGDCVQQGCESDEFDCGNGECIPLNWKCDGEDDCGNGADENECGLTGTWTDSKTNLIWQNPPSSKYMEWDDAKMYCSNLGLQGGGWRLPTISELRTLVRGCSMTESGGMCGVTDSCLSYAACWRESSCWSCPVAEGPDDGCYRSAEIQGPCEVFEWSSSAVQDVAENAYLIHFAYGGVDGAITFGEGVARCVR